MEAHSSLLDRNRCLLKGKRDRWLADLDCSEISRHITVKACSNLFQLVACTLSSIICFDEGDSRKHWWLHVATCFQDLFVRRVHWMGVWNKALKILQKYVGWFRTICIYNVETFWLLHVRYDRIMKVDSYREVIDDSLMDTIENITNPPMIKMLQL